MFSIYVPPKKVEFIPLQRHLSSTPAQYSLDEEPILYYHENTLHIKILDDEVLPGGLEGVLSDSEIFVASSGLSIWSHKDGKGLFIPYTNLILHAISDNSENKTVYLQLSLDPSAETEEFRELEVATKEVQALYEALSRCSSMHFDAGDESELPEEDGSNAAVLDTIEMRAEIVGEADDLPTDDVNVYDAAGLEVELPGLNGRRGRDSEEEIENDAKWRRVE